MSRTLTSSSGMSAFPAALVVIFGCFCGLIVMCRPRPVGPTTDQSNLSPIFASGPQDAASPVVVWIARRAVLPVRRFYQGEIMNEAMTVRPAAAAEIDHLARLWHESWHDAHGRIAPAGAIVARTVDSFRARLSAALDDTRVFGPASAPLGLCMI